MCVCLRTVLLFLEHIYDPIYPWVNDWFSIKEKRIIARNFLTIIEKGNSEKIIIHSELTKKEREENIEINTMKRRKSTRQVRGIRLIIDADEKNIWEDRWLTGTETIGQFV